MSAEQKTVAYMLLYLREKADLTQDEVSRNTGISRGSLAGYETGARKPKYESLKKLADYYGVTVEYILGRDESEQKVEENLDKQILFNTIKGMNDDEARQARAVIEALIRTSGSYGG